jgi:hypothetical protein
MKLKLTITTEAGTLIDVFTTENSPEVFLALVESGTLAGSTKHSILEALREEELERPEPFDGMSDEDAFTSAGHGMDESYGNYDEGYAGFHGEC